ncbi:hypothetical protein GUJ93_ZPchr0009g1833 [Zizania palustris]|uniref:Uncharacterized protein n=1 Tax=Zizania palustris TaxID=103762 RepID=A0A8J5RUD2_ZIZPA|nr:hypothetical protein GUJ93_ZPchr0009g1833 [Zizania palustris]
MDPSKFGDLLPRVLITSCIGSANTCSIDHEENEPRITAFVQRHLDFVPQSVHGYVPAEFVTGGGFYSSSLSKHYIDGAFAARLVWSVL